MMRSRFVTVLDRELHYTEWGADGKPVVLMVHGLLRTCRDFDEIASHLSDRFKVYCVDVIGRGLSQWSQDPDTEYTYPFYTKIVTAFVDTLKIDKFHWIGTSMGGIIGFTCAATALRGRIQRLVLNDIGPHLSLFGLKRILEYATDEVIFNKVSELEAFFRTAYKPFGPQGDEWFDKMTQVQMRRLPDGRVSTHYDPQVAAFLKKVDLSKPLDETLSWQLFDSLECRVLVVRGAESDLLEKDGVEAMLSRGLKSIEAVEIPGVGHAPLFNIPDQIAHIDKFLLAE